ncbi:hypothetical protein QQZ08_012145 [Neonectria magnoliae]|uniref:Uncharacterized protein n=1 Tax=Neonectria magnoliae TaxID=2732573 RepID=A0ABR1H4N5_9HYPO
MEEVVLFRKHMMLGRVLRFQGEFNESLTHLERSRKIAGQRKDLTFDEDLRDLICDLADTLRELDDPRKPYLLKDASKRQKGFAWISSPVLAS